MNFIRNNSQAPFVLTFQLGSGKSLAAGDQIKLYLPTREMKSQTVHPFSFTAATANQLCFFKKKSNQRFPQIKHRKNCFNLRFMNFNEQ